MTAAPQSDRLPTGIPGLDALLEGGLLQGGVYIVQGTPGAGKTIFGNQICFHHTTAGGQASYVTLLAESHARMLSHLRRMRFFDASVIPDRLSYLSGFKVLEAEGLEGLLRLLRNIITTGRPSLLVLDGLISAQEASPSQQSVKKFLHELQALSGMAGCTCLLLTSTASANGVQAADTMADGLIELTDEVRRLRPLRNIEVRKLRGTNQVRGPHTMEITDDGICVHQRIETQLMQHLERPRQVPGRARLPFGIPRLDEMLHGGVIENSVTMLLGSPGSGKTILGMQFLAEGARLGESGLYFGLYERPDSLMAKCERINLGLRGGVERGLIEVLWQPPVEAVLDVLSQRLLRAVRQRRVRRLFLDGLQEMQRAADVPERIRDVFSALIEELEADGVTVVYSMETPDLFGPTIQLPILGVSALTHNIILLRHVELRAQLYRLVSILKLRDSTYDSAIREFDITDQGIKVSDTFQSADQILSGMARSANRKGGPK